MAQKRREKIFSEYPDVVTVKQMCVMLGGISMKTAYKMLECGDIRHLKIGKSFKIPKVCILGNKKSMIRWQDDFYACMAERWPELERGTPAVETKRRHLTPQWYKKVTAMDAKLEQLETTLNNINVFNAGKKREEAVALLAQLLPEVESFQSETQRLRDTIAHERRNASFQREINADLRNELKAERSHSFDQSMKLSELERRCKRAEKLLSKIPQEELDKLLPKQKGLER